MLSFLFLLFGLHGGNCLDYNIDVVVAFVCCVGEDRLRSSWRQNSQRTAPIAKMRRSACKVQLLSVVMPLFGFSHKALRFAGDGDCKCLP
jgi:hypothetical protein